MAEKPNKFDSDQYIFDLADPRLDESQRNALYKIGVELYGVPKWKLEDIAPKSLNEVEASLAGIKHDLEKTIRSIEEGNRRSEKIVAAMLDTTNASYGLDQVIKNNPIDSFTLRSIISKANTLSKTQQAKLAVAAKIANDPKQAEKKFIFQCWQQWQKKSIHTRAKRILPETCWTSANT
jgi:hypothetical protein